MLGEVLLQDSFAVWDPKGLIKQKRDYQIFLFDICILFSKQSKDSNGKNKYQFKFKMNVSATSTWMLGSNLKQLSCAQILFLYVLLHVLKSTFTNLLYSTTYYVHVHVNRAINELWVSATMFIVDILCLDQ